jgi:4-hydroxybenzoate polyprenyltransferase
MALPQFTRRMTKVQIYTNYLLKRFHLVPLFILVLSDILVVYRVLDPEPNSFWKYALALFFVLLYLFGNRVGDDLRDFDFDQKHYPNRAVQKGLLSKKELNAMFYLGYALMIISALLVNQQIVLPFIGLLIISVLAKKDFFLPESFKSKYYFSYNFLNMLQMLALQFFVYLLLGVTQFDQLIIVHVLLVFLLSLQTEVTRKVKAKKYASMDNYSDRLGMKGALLLWFIFALLSTITAFAMGQLLQIDLSLLISLESLFIGLCLLGVLFYAKKANEKGENIFWLCFILFYVGQNLMLTYG